MRILDFLDGFTSASAPTVGSIFVVSGTKASPNNITALAGITASTDAFQLQFIQGSGGAVDVSANPQISAGTTTGQVLVLCGANNTNTVLLENGTGLILNGSYTMGSSSVLAVQWDGVSSWVELFRNDL